MYLPLLALLGAIYVSQSIETALCAACVGIEKVERAF